MRMKNQPFEDVPLIEDGDFPAFQADLEKVKWDAKNRQDGMEFSDGWDGARRPLKMKGGGKISCPWTGIVSFRKCILDLRILITQEKSILSKIG